MTLTEFLLARIADDEVQAKADQADAMTGFRWKHLPEHEYGQIQARELGQSHRWLAECQAKRRILGRHQSDGDRFPLCSTCREVGPDAQAWPCDTLRDLATIYADHSDYDEAWRA